ncbi:hypothetical protein CY35_16G084000 [Sphagnum magellanicum]|nr:hypothetical protein CY35_16G084000 [Sphagnum magellanicum]
MALSESTKLETLHEMKEELIDIPDLFNSLSTTVVVHSDLPYAPTTRFQPGKVKEIIQNVLKEKLGGVNYDSEQAPQWIREITDTIKLQVREMGLERYKIVVQSVIGDQRDQGFQFASKCLWDPATDDYAFGSFVNDKVFGVAGAWAIYLP